MNNALQVLLHQHVQWCTPEQISFDLCHAVFAYCKILWKDDMDYRHRSVLMHASGPEMPWKYYSKWMWYKQSTTNKAQRQNMMLWCVLIQPLSVVSCLYLKPTRSLKPLSKMHSFRLQCNVTSCDKAASHFTPAQKLTAWTHFGVWSVWTLQGYKTFQRAQCHITLRRFGTERTRQWKLQCKLDYIWRHVSMMYVVSVADESSKQ